MWMWMNILSVQCAFLTWLDTRLLDPTLLIGFLLKKISYLVCVNDESLHWMLLLCVLLVENLLNICRLSRSVWTFTLFFFYCSCLPFQNLKSLLLYAWSLWCGGGGCRLGGGSCHPWLTDRTDARRTWPHCFWIILVTATDQMVLKYFQNSSLISVTALFPLTLRESLAIFPKRMHWMFLSFLFEVSKSLR